MSVSRVLIAIGATASEALEPITAEIEQLERQRTLLESLRKTVDAEKSAANNERESLATKRKELADEEKRIRGERERSHAGLLEAEADRAGAKRILEEARSIKDAAVRLSADVNMEVLHRREDVAIQEKNVQLKEDYLKRREAEIEAGWIRLQDRTEAFDRRVNKQKH